MQRIQAVPQRLIGVRIEVAVAVQGEADRGMPGPGGDLLGIRPGSNPQRHCRMPQVMDAQPIQSGRPGQRPPDAMPECGQPQRACGARPGRKAIAVARIDYVNDSNANSIAPSVTAIVPNERGELLMVHKTDNDLWALPGGAMDVGESMADTVVREVKEETGIDVAVTGVVGIYTNPNHVMAYDDGEVRQQCSICFTTRMLGGQLATSSETSEVEFVAPERLNRLNLHPSMRLRIDHCLERRSAPTSADQADPPADAGSDRSLPAARVGPGQWHGAPDHRPGSDAALPRCAVPGSWVGRPARWSCRRR
jgi:ADP-ribose pyrophosphatase YjhB (NUDIX family)